MQSFRSARTRPAFSTILLLFAAVFLARCDDPTGPVPDIEVPPAVTVVSGAGQAAPAASALPVPLVVRVVDSLDRPVQGEPVAWTVVSGGGSVVAESARTDSLGRAAARWTLGSAAGEQRVVASISGGGTAAFLAVAELREAAAVAPVSGGSQTGLAGQTLAEPLVVRVEDGSGDPLPGIEVRWRVVHGSGTLDEPVGSTDAQGLAATRWTVGGRAGVHRVEAVVEGLPGAPLVFEAEVDVPVSAGRSHEVASVDAMVTLAVPEGALGGSANLSILHHDADPGDPGLVRGTVHRLAPEGLSFAPAARLTLAFDPDSVPDGVSPGSLAVHRLEGGAWIELPGGKVDGGRATAPVQRLGVFGVLQRRAIAALDVEPDGPVTFDAVGAVDTVAATPRDANGRPLARAVAWATSDDAVATVSGGIITAVGPGTATVTASVGPVSAAVRVVVDQAPAELVVSPASATLTASGDTVALAAAATDRLGAAVAGVAVTWTSSDTAVATVDGRGVVTAVGDGRARVTAAADGAQASADIEVARVPSTIVIVAGEDQTTPVGTAVRVEPLIRVVDAGGVGVGGVPVTFRVTAGGGQVTGGETTTRANGLAKVRQWILGTTPGANILTVTVGEDTASFTATATPGAAHAGSSTIAAADSALTADGAATTTVTVTVRDRFGSPLEVGGDEVAIRVEGEGSLSPVQDRGDGTYSAVYTAPTTVGTATLTATVGGQAVPGAVTMALKAGPLDGFQVTAADGGDVGTREPGTPFPVRITAVDAYGNRATDFGEAVVVSCSAGLSVGGGTSASFVDGVLASHDVALAAAAAATRINVVDQAGSAAGSSNAFAVDARPELAGSSPAQGATGVSPSGDVSVAFSEAVVVDSASFTLECAGATVPFSVTGSGTAAVTLKPTDGLTGGSDCTVGLVATNVTDADEVDGADGVADRMAADTAFTFTTATVAVPDRYTGAVGNVSYDAAAAGQSLVDNDYYPADATIVFAGWNAVPGATEQGGTVSVTTAGAGLGEFVYEPARGFEGTDRFEYTLSHGGGTVMVELDVSGRVWFVHNASACTTDCDGRLTHPFTSLADFVAVNGTGGSNPGAGDAIFLYESPTGYSAPIRLLDGQRLIGQDANATLSAIAGLDPAPGAVGLPAMNPGADRVTITGRGTGVYLARDNTLRGLSVEVDMGWGIYGVNFGTFTSREDVAVDVSRGAGVHLDRGVMDASFGSLSVDGGLAAFDIRETTGTLSVVGDGTPGSGGVIQNCDGLGQLRNTGTVSLSWMEVRTVDSRFDVRGTIDLVIRQSLFVDNGRYNQNAIALAGGGSAVFDTVTMTGTGGSDIVAAAAGGTLDVTVRGSTIGSRAVHSIVDQADDAITAMVFGPSVLNLTVEDNDFEGLNGEVVDYMYAADAGGRFVFRGNRVSASTDRPHSVRVMPLDGYSFGGSIQYDIRDNDFNGTTTEAIAVKLAASSAGSSLEGYVRDNRIGTPGVAGSCGGDGVVVEATGDGTHVAVVSDNTIVECAGEPVRVDAAGSAASRLDLTLTGNVLGASQDPGSASLSAYVGGPGAANTACLDVGGPGLENRLAGDPGFEFTVEDASALLAGFSGSDADAATSFVRSTNRDGAGSAEPTGRVTSAGGAIGGAVTCSVPGF